MTNPGVWEYSSDRNRRNGSGIVSSERLAQAKDRECGVCMPRSAAYDVNNFECGIGPTTAQERLWAFCADL